jgi:hypothetical protein
MNLIDYKRGYKISNTTTFPIQSTYIEVSLVGGSHGGLIAINLCLHLFDFQVNVLHFTVILVVYVQ